MAEEQIATILQFFFSEETKIMLRFTPLDQENFYVHIWLYLFILIPRKVGISKLKTNEN